MNHLKVKPVGIDIKINRIQKSIYPALVEKWGALDVYGRAYKNQKPNGTKLEVYTEKGEYEPILFSEGNKVFFVEGSDPENSFGTITNDLWAIVIVNLDKIKPNTSHRADEEAREDMFTALSNAVGVEDISKLEYGMDKVARVIENNLSFGNFKFSDIHPYHVFMIKLRVDYTLLINQC